MHPFLNKFIENNFDNELESLVETKNISDDIKHWSSPAVEISNFSLDLISKIKIKSESLFDQFSPVPGSNLDDKNWFSNYSSDNWKELPLVDNSNFEKEYDFIKKEYVNKKQSNPVSDQKDILDLCLELLDVSDPKIFKNLRITTVEAGGYVHPHKDKEQDSRCIWMPLHDFEWCLKFFPFGWLKHELGNAYLINNTTYVHGVYNNSKKRRYILSVDIFKETGKLIEWHQRSEKTWKDIFTNYIN